MRVPALPGEGAAAPRDAVALETVAAGLVQQQPATRRAEDDRQHADGRLDRGQRPQGAVSGVVPDALRRPVVVALHALAGAGAVEAGLDPAVPAGGHAAGDPGADPLVAHEHAVGVGDQDVLRHVDVHRVDATHRRAAAARRVVDAPQDRDLVGRARGARGPQRALHARGGALAQVDGARGRALRCAAALCCGAGRLEQRRQGQHVGEGEAGPAAPQDAHAGADVPVGAQLRDGAGVEAHRLAVAALDEHLDPLAAAPQALGQHRRDEVGVDPGGGRPQACRPTARCVGAGRRRRAARCVRGPAR